MGGHFINLDLNKLKENYAGGSRTAITSKEIASFTNISFSLTKLNKGGCLQGLWHPNAHKIGFCQSGNALVSIQTPTSLEVFTVTEGDILFVPKAFVHYVANTGDSDALIAFALSHAQPEEITVAKAMTALPESVFSTMFHSSPQFFEGLKKSKTDGLICHAPLPKPAHPISNRFKFNIKDSSSLLDNKGGYLKATTKPNLPVLEDLAILGFGLNPKGVVEPHTHPNAGELVYIVRGKARMTVYGPDGTPDVAELQGPGIGFAPAGYFHSIDNIGNENVDVIAFFSHAEPNYIGIGEAVHSLPNELLAATFNQPVSFFEEFKSPAGPVVIAGG